MAQSSYGKKKIDLRNMFFKEIHSDRLFVVPGEDSLAVSLNHGGFSHGTVAHNDNLKKKKNGSKNEGRSVNFLWNLYTTLAQL